MITTGTFSTERLQLAIYLHASGRLSFTGCHKIGFDKVLFTFADPEHMGDQLEFDFERGALISAQAIFASQKFLRRKMSEALDNRDNRRSQHEYCYR